MYKENEVQNIYGIDHSNNNTSENRLKKKEEIRQRAAALLQRKSFTQRFNMTDGGSDNTDEICKEKDGRA